MKVLLTGSTGYIGRRLLPVLVDAGHEVICAVRDRRRFDWDDFSEEFLKKVEVIECDLLNAEAVASLPGDVDAAYYLIHSMGASYQGFSDMEQTTARNFVHYLDGSSAKQVIYLGGIANDKELSKHLRSRLQVEEVLAGSKVPLTVLRAAIIIGSGSASFEIIRDLTEKLPLMIAPRWLNTRCQPIGIRNVMDYLLGVLGLEASYHRTFDIGGTDVLSYKEMLLGFARVRNLQRYILTLPVLSPSLSSRWLYFVTSTTYSLARSLVDSMTNEVICHNDDITRLIPVQRYSYEEALRLAFSKINQKDVVSSWTDAIQPDSIDLHFMNRIKVPEYGCLHDLRTFLFEREVEEVRENIWAIGGERGWYYGNWLWKLRGYLDKLVGGIGLRRGRRSPDHLKPGDSLDFWRVLAADEKNRRLLLYAEMKLPGEAWLEFCIQPAGEKYRLVQRATFRPLGLLGRLYWYLVLPFHALIFPGMARGIIRYQEAAGKGHKHSHATAT